MLRYGRIYAKSRHEGSAEPAAHLAQARLQGDWEADIAAYDDAHEQALEMADALSAGIIHQFPRKFDRMAAR